MYLRTANGLVEYRTRPLPPEDRSRIVAKAVEVARSPHLMATVPTGDRHRVDELVKAIGNAATVPKSALRGGSKGMSAAAIAQRAAQALQPSSSITPSDIEAGLRANGMDMVAPFSPGTPLQPYYGYGRQPRVYDYQIARNTTTETRPDRIPFYTLEHLWKSYDIAQQCTRYSINDLRSMRVRFTAMEGYDDNPVKEIAEAKKRLRRPDGKRFFRNWLAQNQRNLWIYDSAPIFRYKEGGKVKKLVNISAKTIAPMLDYYGDLPDSPAPAFQQFIEGVPWDWLTLDDLIYEPFWPETDSPYGTPPLETVLINANTDLRLQNYFLDFFVKGQVPEAFAIAPEGMTDPDALAELQEDYNDWTYGDQSERWGLRWLPAGTDIQPYKPDHFDPDLAEYVERRTIASFGLVPQNLGLLSDVNRATSDTQVDQQFRVSTLPIVGYYEDLLDAVLQEDWSLPVQVRFDTGREKEDRLNEAKAWQIWIDAGVASPDEPRDNVLGLPIDPQNPVPRMINSQRLGPVPLSYLQEISGHLSPRTYGPEEQPVYREFVVPGATGPDPLTNANNQDEGAQAQAGPPKAQAPKGAQAAGSSDATNETAKELMPGDPEPNSVANPASPSAAVDGDPSAYGGWGMGDDCGSTAQGTGVRSPSDLERERAELAKWRQNSRNRVKKGLNPRLFTDTTLASATVERVWALLDGASSREQVDTAFKAAGPFAAGIAVQASDTGRVVLIQRTPDKHDPDEAYARYEFPGGKLDQPGDTPWTGALREWQEETGASLPAGFSHVGNWTSPDGVYTGFVVTVPRESDLSFDPDPDEVSAVRWYHKDDLDNPEVRDKVTETLDRITPMLKGWSEQPRDGSGKWRHSDYLEWRQFHHHTDTIVDHYMPTMRVAMSEVLDPEAVRRAIEEAYRHSPASGRDEATKAASWRDLLRLAQRATDKLRALLHRLYGDAYMQGAHEASEAAGGEMPSWTVTVSVPEDYWEHWRPGVGEQAAQVAQGGLADVLANAEAWISEIVGTQIERVTEAIDNGVAQGWPIAQTIQAVDAVINDEQRAYLITETEYARAMGRAAMDSYRLNNVPELKWLHEPGACSRCLANAAASPQPTANPRWPFGGIPVHPHERCAVAPVVHVPRRNTHESGL